MASPAIDAFITFRFLKLLVTPFNKTEAFKLGIIDERGKVLKKYRSLERIEERRAYTILHRLVFNIKKLIEKSLIRAKLPGIEKKDPLTLSSGQQARIALIRTLLSKPSMLLLDEPFSNLDDDIRESMVIYVLEEIKNLNIPVLIVSHDPRDIELSTNKPVSFKIFSD